MNPLQQSFRSQFPKITPYRVFRDTEAYGERPRKDLPVSGQPFENGLLALCRQHGLHVFS